MQMHALTLRMPACAFIASQLRAGSMASGRSAWPGSGRQRNTAVGVARQRRSPRVREQSSQLLCLLGSVNNTAASRFSLH
jgi:hypothetical protein